MKITPLAILGLACFITACDQYAPVRGTPVTPQFKSEAASARVVDYVKSTTRSFIEGEVEINPADTNAESPFQPKGPMIEVTGVACVAESPEFRLEFVTPTTILMPLFQGRPGPLKVVCKGDGLSQSFTAKPQLYGVMVGGPSPAGLIAAAVSAGVAASQDQWSYGDGGSVFFINMEKDQ
jgi:hypothetical protein